MLTANCQAYCVKISKIIVKTCNTGFSTFWVNIVVSQKRKAVFLQFLKSFENGCKMLLLAEWLTLS